MIERALWGSRARYVLARRRLNSRAGSFEEIDSVLASQTGMLVYLYGVEQTYAIVEPKCYAGRW